MAKWLVWICWTVFFAILPTVLTAIIGFLFRAGTWPTLSEILGSGQLFLTAIGVIGYAARELAARDGRTLARVRFTLIFLCFGLMFLLGGIYGAIYAAGLPNPATGAVFILIPRELILNLSIGFAIPCLIISGVVSLIPSAGRTDGKDAALA